MGVMRTQVRLGRQPGSNHWATEPVPSPLSRPPPILKNGTLSICRLLVGLSCPHTTVAFHCDNAVVSEESRMRLTSAYRLLSNESRLWPYPFRVPPASHSRVPLSQKVASTIVNHPYLFADDLDPTPMRLSEQRQWYTAIKRSLQRARQPCQTTLHCQPPYTSNDWTFA